MMPNLPYEAIGVATVLLVATVLALLIALLAALAMAFVWIRFWQRVVNWCWRGHDPTNPDDAPPQGWRRKLSIIALGLSKFKRPSEIHEAIKNAHEL